MDKIYKILMDDEKFYFISFIIISWLLFNILITL